MQKREVETWEGYREWSERLEAALADEVKWELEAAAVDLGLRAAVARSTAVGSISR